MGEVGGGEVQKTGRPETVIVSLFNLKRRKPSRDPPTMTTALQAALRHARKTMLRDVRLGYQAFFISFLTVRLADVTTRSELLVLSPL